MPFWLVCLPGSRSIPEYDVADHHLDHAPEPRGWVYNPGQQWPLFDKAGHLPDCTGASFAEKDGKPGCIKIVEGQPNWKSQGRPDLGTVPASQRQGAPPLLPRAATQAEARDMLAKALGLDSKPMPTVKTPGPLCGSRHY